MPLNFLTSMRLLLSIFLLLNSICISYADNAEKIFPKISKSVVLIFSLNDQGELLAQGSGVVIAPSKIITNWHIVENASSIVVSQSNINYPSELLSYRSERDLAYLSVPGIEAPSVELSSINRVKVGQQVYAVGAPNGLELTISKGIISALRDTGGSKIIQTDAAISPGSSGGGLFDEQGRLLGITTFKFTGESLNFALPVDWITDFKINADIAIISKDFYLFIKLSGCLIFIVILVAYRAKIFNFFVEMLSAKPIKKAKHTLINETNIQNFEFSKDLDQYLLDVKSELERNFKDDMLWKKAVESSNGIIDRAKSNYIQLRVKKLQIEDKDKLWNLALEKNKNANPPQLSAKYAKDYESNKPSSRFNESKIKNLAIWIIFFSILIALTSLVFI